MAGLLLLTAAAQAPAVYTAACRTTGGNFTLTIHRDWAPRAADRFYELLSAHYYAGNAFYRVVPGFVVQWGLSPTPALSQAWRKRTIPDDPVTHSNRAGTISFAASGRNSRTTEVFINLADHPALDKQGFAPFGEVTAGLSTVRELEGGYGDGPPRGHGPDPRLILSQGAAYLTHFFPRLDILYGCEIAGPPSTGFLRDGEGRGDKRRGASFSPSPARSRTSVYAPSPFPAAASRHLLLAPSQESLPGWGAPFRISHAWPCDLAPCCRGNSGPAASG